MVDNFENSIFENSTNLSMDNNVTSRRPTWMKSSFLSILNLPFQIKQFGHLRYYWDGTHERAIQNIKPYLKKARSTDTFFQRKMEEMYTNQFVDILCDYFIKNAPSIIFQNSNIRNTKYMKGMKILRFIVLTQISNYC